MFSSSRAQLLSPFRVGENGHAPSRAAGGAAALLAAAPSLLTCLLTCLGFFAPGAWANATQAAAMLAFSTGWLLLGPPGDKAVSRGRRVVFAALGALALTWAAAFVSGAASARLAPGAAAGLGAAVVARWITPDQAGRAGRAPLFAAFLLRWQICAAAALAASGVDFVLFDAQLDAAALAGAEFGAFAAIAALTIADRASRAATAMTPAGALATAIAGIAAAGPFLTGEAALPYVATALSLSTLLAVLGGGAALCAASGALCAMIGPICAALAPAAAPGWAWVLPQIEIAALLLGAVLVATPPDGRGEAPPALTQRFQSVEARWLVRLDLDARTAHFPLADAPDRARAPYASLFALSERSALMDLFRQIAAFGALDAPEADAAGGPSPLTLCLPGEAPGLMRVRILARAPGRAWLSLAAESDRPGLAAELANCQNSLADARAREEHLLAVASHEMRTPVAILSMLIEDMKTGAIWDELGPSMESAVARLANVAEDLRAETGGRGDGGAYTLAEIAAHIAEAFEAPPSGMRLRIEQSDDARTLLQGAPTRIIVALSKLVQNAFAHSHGAEVVVSAFLSRGDDPLATWTVRDDGVGISPERRDRIFDAFRGGPGAGVEDAAPGLGLYYARKSLSLIGGKLWLDAACGPGACFVMTHPVRLAETAPEPDIFPSRSSEMPDEVVPYRAKTALLVEDNKLVGELTAKRLRKLFGGVVWEENGANAVRRFQDAQPEIVFVDQLLPGMTGDAVVTEIRKLSRTVVIVGVTASTLGSECERLEAAGANMAVEKPLTFDQTRSIARQFFGESA